MLKRAPNFILTAAAAFLLFTACERPREVVMTAPHPSTVRLPEPDPTFRLTEEERGSIRPGFDADALERLLAAIEPGARRGLLQAFLTPAPGQRARNVVQMGDPELQPLLDQVWLPFWESRPDRLRRRHPDDQQWPGLELARKRSGIQPSSD